MKYNIGTKIKHLRLEKNISQNELCGNFINRSILSKIENNQMLPSIEQLQYISDKLNKPLAYFFSNYTEENIIDITDNTELKEMFINENYSDIVKLYEYNKIEFRNIKDFNKFYYLGISFYKLKMYHDAIKPLKKYINEYTRSEEDVQKRYILNFSSALNFLHLIMDKNSNSEKAIHYLSLGIKYLYKYNATNSRISYVIHNNLAAEYIFTNNFTETVILLEKFLNCHNDLSYINILADMYISLNIAYYNLREYEKSIRYIKKSIYSYLYQERDVEAGKCYLNLINVLRHSKKFDEASALISTCKINYKDYKALYNNFLIQEMIIYMNTERYEDIINLSKIVNISELCKMDKSDYYFIVGHAMFLHSDFDNAQRYLPGCEKYFLKKGFYYDLHLVYDDLYNITKDEEYKIKSIECENKPSRKNILIIE